MAYSYDIPTVTIRMAAMVCGKCGIHFAVDERVNMELREQGRTFYCPNGDPRVYSESEVDKLRKETQALKIRAEQARKDADRYYEQKEAEKRSHSATKGKLTKTRNRIANGVCPECHRHFTNVERHMHTQHPNMTKAV